MFLKAFPIEDSDAFNSIQRLHQDKNYSLPQKKSILYLDLESDVRLVGDNLEVLSFPIHVWLVPRGRWSMSIKQDQMLVEEN